MNYFFISVAKDFSKFPAGRTLDDGSLSGETFFHNVLWPALIWHDKVTVDLDGTLGYGSSWLEGAFKSVPPNLRSKITIKASDESLIVEIMEYMQ